MRLGLVLAATALALSGQEAGTPVIRSDAREVLIDAVVRDRGGQIIRGLTAADFEVREDGVPQRIVSVRETGTQPPATVEARQQVPAASAEAPPPAPDSLKQVHLVSLVFDQLAPSSRRLAKEAALEMLKARSELNTWYAVFVIQNNLRVLQSFTASDEVLRAAIDRATGGSRIDFENAQQSLASTMATTRGAADAATASAALGATVDAAGLANQQISRVVQDMLDFAEGGAREQQGRSSLYSLLAIANAQRAVPGRKTVLYFSEGLALPNSVWHVLQSVISAANRANVTLYSIDARGLEGGRDTQLQQALIGGGGANARALYSSTGGDTPVSRRETMAADAGLDAIRANPQQSLLELAESTGGFLVANTNDLRRPVRRIAQEAARYYEITYRPTDTRYDGQFRRIEVRMKRPGLSVHARSGYFAFPAWASHALFPYEIPLLKAVAQRPLPKAVEYRAAALRFRPGPRSAQVAIVTEAALNDLTFRREEDGKGYRTHVSAVALLRDDEGTVAAKLARDVPVVTPADKLDQFRRGEFILTQTAKVAAPGRYTLESAFADRLNDRMSARRSVVVIPNTPGGVRLSSLTLVRRVDASATTSLDDPFQVKGGRVIPYLADTLRHNPDHAIVVYFTVYPMAIAGESPKLTIEIRADHTPVARVTPQLPEPLEDGSIRYVASAPMSALARGLYEIRVSAEQAGTTAQESLFVTIE